MPRSISTNLLTHYAGEVRTIARCWKITRTDSVVLGFTDHDQDIVYDGTTYEALSSGSMTNIEANDNLAADNLNFEMVLNSEKITKTDVIAGRYEKAKMWIFEVNYESLADGHVTLAYGYIGEITLHDTYINAEFRSLSQLLQNNIGRVYLPTCDAKFCDSRCGLTESSYTTPATVTAITDRSEFSIAATAGGSTDYINGRVEFTSGDNDGLSMEIKQWTSTIKLVLPMPFNITVGDTFNMIEGCKKTKDECKNRFNNLVNFRGFPDVPGVDKMLQYPSLH